MLKVAGRSRISTIRTRVGNGSGSPMQRPPWTGAGHPRTQSPLRPCVIRRKDDTMRHAALWSLRGLGPLALAFLVGASSLVPADAARARFSSVPTVDVPMYRGSAAGNAVLTTDQNLTLNWISPFLKSIVVDAVPY